MTTGEIEETLLSDRQQRGEARGKAHKKALTPERRREIAKKAAAARWD